MHPRGAHAAHKPLSLMFNPVVNVGIVAGGVSHDKVLELGHLLHERFCLAVQGLVEALELRLLALAAVLPLLLALAALGGGSTVALKVALKIALAPIVCGASGGTARSGLALFLA